MAEKIAAFRFIGYKIVESSIKYNPELSDFENLSVNIKNTTGINEEELKLKLELELEVKNDSDDLNVVVKAIGIFEFDSNLSDKHKEIFFNTSAPAILFPYIRAYITSLTALSGIQPIILPTINLSGRSNKSEQE